MKSTNENQIAIKKLVLLLVIAFLLGFTSCKKENTEPINTDIKTTINARDHHTISREYLEFVQVQFLSSRTNGKL